MNEVLVLADGATTPAGASRSANTLELRTAGRNANVKLHLDAFRTNFLSDLPERCDDLIRLATCVYSADTRVSRGSEKDILGKKWSRTFRVVMPVRDLTFWNNPSVSEAVT